MAEFKTIKVLMPESWCMFFYSDGTSTSHEQGPMVEREMLVHIREPEGDAELPDDSLPEDAEEDEGA